ncbi:MAG: hypothetical protein AB7O26_07020 [Planctomycetaceae bacterium]
MTAQPSDDDSASRSAAQDDDLPTHEPLTPELVEDEALRGDFVIRWSVVLLALLAAMTEIAESPTLVHVKSGQYIAGHGWLPPRLDVFSYTAADRPWTNLSWFFDLVVAGVFAVGGGVGLSVFKAVIAAATFALVIQTRRAGVSTWWSSICAAAAIIACQARMTAMPELITLLGLALVLWLWNRWEQTGNVRALQWLAPLFLVWANLDSRMFLGLALFGLLALGETARLALDRGEGTNSSRLKTIWTWWGASALATLVNPFGWKSLLAPLSLYSVEYPTLRAVYAGGAGERDYSPITSIRYWQPMLPETAAALFLIVAVFVLFVLNRSRRPLGPLFAVCGFAVFAAICAHEIAATALVCAVLAGIQAQDWYQRRFRQTYSIATSEIVFSRGGRAATVLALLLLALAQIGGRLAPSHRGQAGAGINAALTAHSDDLREHVADALDDRPFNFYLEQGDLLIWVGQRDFIDSRIALFAGSNGNDLVGLHRSVRDALRSLPSENSPETWKATFEKYEVTHVLPKLAGSSADYPAFLNLRRSRDWKLTKLTASTASFYRTAPQNDDASKISETVRDYLDKHAVNYVREAFRSELPPPEERLEWAAVPVSYFQLFRRPQGVRPNSMQLSLHYQRQIDDAVSNRNVQLPAQVGSALAHLAIRNANAGLTEAPQSAEGYRALGLMYEFLGRLEARMMGVNALGPMQTRRYYQALAAYRQALVLEPNHRFTHRALAGLYSSQGKFEPAMKSLDQYQLLQPKSADPGKRADEEKLNETIQKLYGQMNERVKGAEERVAQLLQSPDADFLSIATFAYNEGNIERAGQILEGKPELILNRPEAQLLLSQIYFELGRFAEAEAGLERLEQTPQLPDNIRWAPTAGMVALGRARYDRAIELWGIDGDDRQSQGMRAVLQSMPLVGSPSVQRWPLIHSRSVVDLFGTTRIEISGSYYERALCLLESGRNKEAGEMLRTMLEAYPATPLRPLAAFYLNLVTGDEVDPRPPTEQTSDVKRTPVEAKKP